MGGKASTAIMQSKVMLPHKLKHSVVGSHVVLHPC